jgi:hypothetical protein
MLQTMRSIPRRRSLKAPAAGFLVAAVAALALAGSASAAQLAPVVSNEPAMVDVAFDTAGNMYVSEFNGAVKVLPTASGTIFGTPVTAGTLTTIATLTNVPGLAFDSSGDLFMTDTDQGTISVLPAASGTIFGQAVTANQVATLETGLDAPVGLTFDGAGNLYVATQTGVSVLPQSSGTIFGQAVTADTLTPIVSGLSKGAFVAFDAAGNLYVSDFTGGTVSVLASSSGSVFGTPVTANTLTTLLSGQSDPAGLAFDGAGDLFVDTYGTLNVLPVASGTIAGVPVTANTLTQVANGMLGDLGSTYAGGSVYVADQLNESIDRLQAPTAAITGVSFGGTVRNPVVLVNGSGFQTNSPTTAAGCNASGLDYPYGNLFLNDATDGFGAGIPGDCIGLNVGLLSGTQAAYGLGDFYATYNMQDGDQYTVQVDGQTFSGTVQYGDNPASATVTGVSPASGAGGGGNTVRISGTSLTGVEAVFFGSLPATSFAVSRSNLLTAVAPPNAAGTVDVTLVTANGISSVNGNDQYTYVAPTITSVTPSSGPGAGGTKVTIRGTNLQGVSSVLFGGDAATAVSVNRTGTSITATTPSESAGTVDVVVTTPGGTADDAGAFTFLAPLLTRVSPSSGPASGGNTVTIRGTALQGASEVTFGGTDATFTVNAAGTSITATAPAGSSGPAAVVVTTPAGQSNSLTYTYR